MGSALMGSLQMLCSFDGGAFWGTPGNLLLSSQKCQGIPFSQICRKSLLLQWPHWCWPQLSTTKYQAVSPHVATGSDNCWGRFCARRFSSRMAPGTSLKHNDGVRRVMCWYDWCWQAMTWIIGMEPRGAVIRRSRLARRALVVISVLYVAC